MQDITKIFNNACSPGEIIGSWFMQAWGSWYAYALSEGIDRGLFPFGIIAGWFVGG
jgi:hypothetical protein